MTKKFISVVLALVMVLSLFTVIPFEFSAQETDIASVSVTQNEAVQWLNAQNGASYDFGNFYDDEGHLWGGTQCVEFVRAYVNWVVNGNPWADAWGGGTGNGDTIWQNPIWARLGWNVYYNTADFMPKPGDIFSSTGGCHTGVVISSDLSTATIADANARNSNPYDGDSVWIHQITWRSAGNGAYGATYYIRPNFSGGGTPSYPLQKAIDKVEGGVNCVTVAGWCYVLNDHSIQMPIHVYIGGPAGNPNAEGHGELVANQCRQDLDDQQHCGAYHGFSGTLSTAKTGNQPVYIYACVGDNPCIWSGNVNIVSESIPPEITDITISQVTSKGYRISCRVSDESGIGGVKFPAWMTSDQSDIVWYDGIVSNGIATVYVPASDHSYSSGPYITHIYASDIYGNAKSVEADRVTLTDEPIEVAVGAAGNKKYILYNSGKTWEEAEAWCVEHGGHLADTGNWTTIVKLLEKMNGTPCWFGGNDLSGDWKWVNEFNNFRILGYYNNIIYPKDGSECCKDYPIWNKKQPDSTIGEHYLGTFNENYMDAYLFNNYNNDSNGYVGAFVYECERDKLIEAHDIELNEKTGVWSWIGDPNADYYTVRLIDYDNGKETIKENVSTNYFDASKYMVRGKKYWVYLHSYSNDTLIGDSVARSSSFLYNPSPKIINGDSDKDGSVTIIDATLIQKWLARLVTDNDIDLSAADTDKDKYVTISDATRIQKYLAGIINEL